MLDHFAIPRGEVRSRRGLSLSINHLNRLKPASCSLCFPGTLTLAQFQRAKNQSGRAVTNPINAESPSSGGDSPTLARPPHHPNSPNKPSGQPSNKKGRPSSLHGPECHSHRRHVHQPLQVDLALTFPRPSTSSTITRSVEVPTLLFIHLHHHGRGQGVPDHQGRTVLRHWRRWIRRRLPQCQGRSLVNSLPLRSSQDRH